MSRMLNFHNAAWASARDCASQGRRVDALACLKPLLASPDTPIPLLVLAHRLAARLHTDADNYRRARKHLLLAVRFDPNDAEIQYELGLNLENDPYGCDQRAARRFARAVKFAPYQPRFQAAFGRALVRINRVRTGLKYLVLAAEKAATDLDLLAVIIDGLCDANRVKLANRILTQARFLSPNNRKLQELVQFVQYATAQKSQNQTTVRHVSAGPVLLPFMRIFQEEPTESHIPVIVRRDRASQATPHLGRLRAYRTEQR